MKNYFELFGCAYALPLSEPTSEPQVADITDIDDKIYPAEDNLEKKEFVIDSVSFETIGKHYIKFYSFQLLLMHNISLFFSLLASFSERTIR